MVRRVLALIRIMTGVDSDVITTDRTYLRGVPKFGTYTTGLVTFTQVCV